ncbi:MAG: AzlD domain-containing protein [Maritimibacter sp.]|nr:AzlD domain-containing protein [Maritimibacter sp.]
MIPEGTQIWTVIAGLAAGTFLIRFSFLGLVGDRPLPEWLLRLLRYTPVAVIPGLVAPLVLFPQATGGTPDTARLTAAAVTVAVGLLARNTLYGIAAGAAALYGMFWLGL